ncbi:ATP-dependent DNA helicase PIF4-like [Helianthus annuus]|uniref:ATP-dependent DNA helicase PIF4-like n=1 Tax=Helianthus annuus TaxID=4232 RepID=UPI000B8F17AC|nr:ATP-dependent DNA helicase PIF4-like [Helianthus annuus]
MSDDIILNLRQVAGTSNVHFCGPNLQQYVLYEIEMLLNSNTSSRSLAEFGLPMPPDTMVAALRNRLLMEERCYDLEALAAQNIIMLRGLNDRQRKIYDKVLKSVNDKVQVLLFVYGHGGTGKTYLWTAIIAALRSTGKIVLAVAASGIASLLLPSGRTAHSRFKILLDLTDDSLCNIKKHTQLAQLLLETSLIIWDEAPMSDRRCFESLDKSLRDVLGNQDKPFGGKSVLLGGDFRQTLPVKPKASKAEIIASSLPKSYLWDKFSIHMLTENMRLSQSNATVTEKEAITSFSNWILDVGDGKIGAVDEESPSESKFIDIPAQYLIQSGENGLRELIRFVYDDNLLKFPTSITLSERAIACPRNDTADQINDMILASSPGEC